MSRPTPPGQIVIPSCTDCGPVSRRQFLRTTAGGVAAVTAASAGLLAARSAFGAEGAAAAVAAPEAETLVAALFKTLTDGQKEQIAFPFDHRLRSEVDNNWMIVDHSIGEVMNADQQAMVKEIFRK